MIWVSSQPDNIYFHWQVEVYVKNFLKLGILPQNIHAIFLIDKEETEGLKILKEKLPIRIFTYQIEKSNYVPVYKPQGMRKHAAYLRGSFFYHDSDIVLLNKPDVEKLCTCAYYASDVKSYLGVNYIKSKGEGLFEAMCNAIGISPKLVEYKDKNCGGAQFVMNNTPEHFWQKVEHDSLVLLSVMEKFPYPKRDGYPIQSWTSEMWATLWNIYAYGKELQVIDELSFTFSTSKIQATERVKILHNAGVTPNSRENMFYKGDFIDKSPLGMNFDYVSKEFASSRYIQEFN